MKSSSLLRAMVLVIGLAGLSACGGGGDSGAASANSVGSTIAPTPPSNTGLSTPTLSLSQSLSAVIPLVEEMVSVYALADDAQATKALGSLVPGIGGAAPQTYSCSSGQIDLAANADGSIDYTYNTCSDGTYTFSGTSRVTPTVGAGGAVTSYRLDFANLQFAGPGGLVSTASGSVTCLPPATAGAGPSCTTDVGNYVWGSDISYSSSGTANGSHQCNCGQGTWNVTFNDFTPTSGEANVFATNGSASVTRTGAKTFTVVLFLGTTAETYSVTLP